MGLALWTDELVPALFPDKEAQTLLGYEKCRSFPGTMRSACQGPARPWQAARARRSTLT